MKIYYEKVEIIGVKRWKIGGKRRQKTKRFWQVISPYNCNEDGTVKTREQIMEELLVERDAWLHGGGVMEESL